MEWYYYCLLDETSPQNTRFSNSKEKESGIADIFLCFTAKFDARQGYILHMSQVQERTTLYGIPVKKRRTSQFQPTGPIVDTKRQ